MFFKLISSVSVLIRPYHEDHGDHVIVTESKGGNGGGVVMLGRSDGVLNPGGVRFGSAELYDVANRLEIMFALSD